MYDSISDVINQIEISGYVDLSQLHRLDSIRLWSKKEPKDGVLSDVSSLGSDNKSSISNGSDLVSVMSSSDSDDSIKSLEDLDASFDGRIKPGSVFLDSTSPVLQDNIFDIENHISSLNKFKHEMKKVFKHLSVQSDINVESILKSSFLVFSNIHKTVCIISSLDHLSRQSDYKNKFSLSSLLDIFKEFYSELVSFQTLACKILSTDTSFKIVSMLLELIPYVVDSLYCIILFLLHQIKDGETNKNLINIFDKLLNYCVIICCSYLDYNNEAINKMSITTIYRLILTFLPLNLVYSLKNDSEDSSTEVEHDFKSNLVGFLIDEYLVDDFKPSSVVLYKLRCEMYENIKEYESELELYSLTRKAMETCIRSGTSKRNYPTSHIEPVGCFELLSTRSLSDLWTNLNFWLLQSVENLDFGICKVSLLILRHSLCTINFSEKERQHILSYVYNSLCDDETFLESLSVLNCVSKLYPLKDGAVKKITNLTLKGSRRDVKLRVLDFFGKCRYTTKGLMYVLSVFKSMTLSSTNSSHTSNSYNSYNSHNTPHSSNSNSHGSFNSNRYDSFSNSTNTSNINTTNNSSISNRNKLQESSNFLTNTSLSSDYVDDMSINSELVFVLNEWPKIMESLISVIKSHKTQLNLLSLNDDLVGYVGRNKLGPVPANAYILLLCNYICEGNTNSKLLKFLWFSESKMRFPRVVLNLSDSDKGSVDEYFGMLNEFVDLGTEGFYELTNQFVRDEKKWKVLNSVRMPYSIDHVDKNYSVFFDDYTLCENMAHKNRNLNNDHDVVERCSCVDCKMDMIIGNPEHSQLNVSNTSNTLDTHFNPLSDVLEDVKNCELYKNDKENVEDFKFWSNLNLTNSKNNVYERYVFAMNRLKTTPLSTKTNDDDDAEVIVDDVDCYQFPYLLGTKVNLEFRCLSSNYPSDLMLMYKLPTILNHKPKLNKLLEFNNSHNNKNNDDYNHFNKDSNKDTESSRNHKLKLKYLKVKQDKNNMKFVTPLLVNDSRNTRLYHGSCQFDLHFEFPTTMPIPIKLYCVRNCNCSKLGCVWLYPRRVVS